MRTITLVTLLTCFACAQITQHVTDLSIFNLLAPCASSAVSYNVVGLTDSFGLGCGTAEARLQSCICSQSDVSSQVAQNVSEGVQSECGKSAMGDLWSASQVLKQYCSPGETITFSTPTTNVVMRYITDIDKMNFLAPCASWGLSSAVDLPANGPNASSSALVFMARENLPSPLTHFALPLRVPFICRLRDDSFLPGPPSNPRAWQGVCGACHSARNPPSVDAPDAFRCGIPSSPRTRPITMCTSLRRH